MSVGGVLGGIFNSLVAPLVFPHAYEYPIVLILGCLMVPKLTRGSRTRPRRTSRTPNGSPRRSESGLRPGPRLRHSRLSSASAFYYLTKLPTDAEWFRKLVNSRARDDSGLSMDTIIAVLVYAIPVMLCFFFVDRPLRFALCVAAILGAHHGSGRATDGMIHTERSFFGILKVEEREPHYNRLVHGTTLHGTQVNEKFKLHWADDIQMAVRSIRRCSVRRGT